MTPGSFFLLLILPVNSLLYASLYAAFQGKNSFPVIHPSCGRLHGQLKKTVWLAPNEATTCCSTTSPPLCLHPPLGTSPLRGWGVTALVLSSALEPWGKHGDWRQTRQLAPALIWESHQDQPPVRSLRLCHTSKPTVEGNCQQADLPPPPRNASPLYADYSVMLCWRGEGEGWNHREITEVMAWIGLDAEERAFLLLWRDCDGIIVLLSQKVFDMKMDWNVHSWGHWGWLNEVINV